MKLNKKEINEFHNRGFCIVDIGCKNHLINLRKKWIKMFNNISSEMYGINIKNDNDLLKLEKSKYRKVFVAVFDLIHLDPEVFLISSVKKIFNYAKQLGVRFPHHGTRPLTRVDFPKDKKYSYFDCHQDFPYNKHSLNSVVIWIPLQDTGVKEGCLEVSPRTHQKKKIFKMKKNSMLIKDSSSFKFIKTKVKTGEALIFSEFLVHRSGKNISEKIRFSIQLRLTDLLSKEYMKKNYPVIS
tara:strand:- start:84 stop:803 length:720 start_codon:yes stop_codon:yes gene_type:complete